MHVHMGMYNNSVYVMRECEDVLPLQVRERGEIVVAL